MRIGVNTRFLIKGQLEGFGWYTYEVLRRLVKSHPEHKFIFFFDRKPDPVFHFSDNVQSVHLLPPARRPWLFKIWFNHSIKQALKRYKCDLFFSPDGYLSLTTDIPQIGVIHDINFEHYPEDLPKKYSRYLKKYFPKFAHKAQHIITVSEYSKNDISQSYGVEPDKITVAHNGANENFVLLSDERKKNVRKAFTNELPYFVFVSAMHPRKNIGVLLKAFEQLKKENKVEHQLVVVGKPFWHDAGMEAAYNAMEHRSEVIFTGHVPQQKLTDLVGAAEALVFPSYYEGFGLPIIEAMQAATPVICSNATVHPEVAGDAALYFPPDDAEYLKELLLRITKEENLKEKLATDGLKRAKFFDWKETAQKVAEVIQSIKK